MRALGLAGLTLLFAAANAAPTAAGAVGLEGTWHVLVHYRDDASPSPEKWRWEDRVWEFERKGSRRLEWVEYPIVVFTDSSGRFERRQGQYARVLHKWEPSAGQLEEIRRGLSVNTRGSKRKTLRGSDAKGWRSSGGPAAASASVVSYVETWSIEGLPELPVFVQEDSLSSGRMEGMSGRTEFRAERVLEDGNRIEGRFERDGTRHGTFRMTRAGPVSGVGSRDQSERQRDALMQTLQTSASARAIVREELEERLASSGVVLGPDALEKLTEEAIELLSQGLSEEAIAERLSNSARERYFDFAKPKAEHDASVRYRLPFDASVPRKLTQGVGGDVGVSSTGTYTVLGSHAGRYQHAFDFAMPVGTEVRAARGGEVVRVVDGFTEGGPQKGLAERANVVVVLHEDGTFALYAHLSPGIPVEPADRVEAGDPLGKSGNTGATRGPHLHFSVLRLDGDGKPESLPIRFDDGSPEGYVPVAGLSYGAGGAVSEQRSRAEP